MQELVVCFLVQGDEVILGRRKNPNRPWHKMLSGFGGNVELGETPEKAQVREFQEETSAEIQEENLFLAGKIFLNLGGKEKILYVYLIERCVGDLQETKEMSPEKYTIAQIPFHEMVAGDELWLTWVLAGYSFEARLKRGEDLNKLTEFEFISFSFNY